ncbi:hypothetical protein [Kribbella kalugense]|uniref:Uncharacterized protein n=1 Tax=Kribbella kalugense TaxID=2512221 RepID=A0A4R7ZUJ3_9ACTN|nr:hypothetical protein [Kribbella kalugense]TDW21266.1 hypothetical protein EV650_0084 [Kribbella kalugense]
MTTPDDRRFDALDNDRVLDDTERMDAEPGGYDTARTPDTRTPDGAAPNVDMANEPLVAEESSVDYKARWEVIQQGFVDDPRNAVTEADKLVDDLLQELSDSFDRQHDGLEKQWSAGEPSTEDLRSALQRYRAFFQRLLTL